MYLKRILLLIIACSCFSWLIAQSGCGTVTIVSLEEFTPDEDDQANGSIKVVIHDTEPDAENNAIAFAWTGPNSSEPVTILPSEPDTYIITSLPAGDYTVKVVKFCIADWNSITEIASEDEGAVTVRSIPYLRATVREDRPALSSCVPAAIAEFIVLSGTAPYSLTVESVPQGKEALLGNVYTFNENTFYFSGLKAGDYTFTLEDDNGYKVQNLTLTITTLSLYHSYLGFSYTPGTPPATSTYVIKPYLDHVEGPFNVFVIEGRHINHYNSNYASSYLTNADSISKYFNIVWYFEDEPNITYPAEYKKVKESDAAKRWCLTLPAGLDFKYVSDNSKRIWVRQDGYNPDVRADDWESDGSCWNDQLTNDIIWTEEYLKKYEPITQSDSYQFETFFDNQLCKSGLRFPVASSSDIELVILPITYSIYKKEEGNNLTEIAKDLVYEAPALSGYRNAHLEAGWYIIEYEDRLGNAWSQEIELEDADEGIMTNISLTVAAQRRGGSTPTDYAAENLDDYEDIGSRVAVWFNFEGGATSNLTVTYEEVPPGFYFPAGSTEAISAGTTQSTSLTFYINNGFRYYQFVPGKYVISLTPEGCGQPHIEEFIIDKAGIDEFEYEITSDCSGVSVTALTSVSRMLRRPQANDDGSPDYWPSPHYCLARERTSISGVVEREYLGTSTKDYRTDKTTVIPYSDFTTMNGEQVVDYKLSIHFFLSSTSSLGSFTGSTRNYYYAREIDIDLSKIESGEYGAFKFDASKSSGFMCGQDANITVMATGGSPDYTYTLYETDSSLQPPVAGSSTNIISIIDTKTAGANEPVVFEFNDPQATTKYYWVEAIDASGCFEPKYQSITVYTLDASLAITKTEDLCDGDALTLTAVYIPDATYTWYRGGEVQDGTVVGGTRLYVTGNVYTVSNISDLHMATYHVHVNDNNGDCGINMIYSADVRFVPQLMVWDPQSGSSDWDNEQNWYPKGEGVPRECTDVYIPGNVNTFPSLVQGGGSNACRDIYFMPGAQLGQPQLLDYRYSYVELDFGEGIAIGSRSQDKSVTKEDLVNAGRDNVTSEQRIKFASATSGVTLERNRWNMLSAPLGNITTGDFAFGGFPFSYIKKFDAENGSEKSYISGTWADFSNEADMRFMPGQGFGHLYYDYDQAPYYSMDHSSQWDAVKAAHSLTSPTPQSIHGDNVEFGLAESNGILQFPYFADEYLSKTRRWHNYSGLATSGTSTFYFYRQAPRLAEDFLQWTGGRSSSYRSEYAYRFIPEQVTINKKKLDFTYNAGNFTEGDVLLVGNPYMSALDFDAFAAANPGIKSVGYQLFNGTDGYHESTNGSGGNHMVAPMQSFLVEAAATGNLNLVFNAEEMAKTDSGIKLKSVHPVQANKLTIIACNPEGEVKAYIKQHNEADDGFCSYDLSKIISSPAMSMRPDIYTLALTEDNSKRALLINTIKSNDIIIPVGIITTYQGEIKLELTGMSNYDADIVFIDVEAKQAEMNITGLESFSYPYISKPVLNSDGSADAMENRFMIRISPGLTTGFEPVNEDLFAYIHNNDLIISSLNNIIEGVQLYDLQGRIIFTENNIQSAFYKAEDLFHMTGVYIVKVYTQKGIKEFKLIR